ncbi:MAG: hypothetical protein IJW03_01040 [Clostridia bacterium]|nr:hypothetical protein [Clostridia bacterium]
MKLGNLYMIQMQRSGDTVTLYEVSSKNNNNKNELCKIGVGEWFNLRVEYYIP